jgi:hypothetical protein
MAVKENDVVLLLKLPKELFPVQMALLSEFVMFETAS